MTSKTTKITTETLDSAPTARIHFIPAETDTSEAANVQKYFEQFAKTDQNGVISNSLRGFPLVGKEFSVPPTHQGVVISSAKGDSSCMKISKQFKEFVYWNYDILPSRNDSLHQAMDWIDISRALHEEEDSLVE